MKLECSKYPNIHYYGELSFNRYMDLLHKVSFLLSTRDPKEKGNQCNFPSKIIEGILHNRIIISTIKYKQLAGLKYFFVSSDEDELKIKLRESLEWIPLDLSGMPTNQTMPNQCSIPIDGVK